MKIKYFLTFLLLSYMVNCAISSSLQSISTISNSISMSLSSISTSLESISDSLRSSSKSISGDEKSALKEQKAYKAEIRYLTAYVLKESIPPEDYLREMGRIARQYGIYHWQTNPNTYIGIGEGLKLSNISSKQFQELLSAIKHEELKNYLMIGYQN